MLFWLLTRRRLPWREQDQSGAVLVQPPDGPCSRNTELIHWLRLQEAAGWTGNQTTRESPGQSLGGCLEPDRSHTGDVVCRIRTGTRACRAGTDSYLRHPLWDDGWLLTLTQRPFCFVTFKLRRHDGEFQVESDTNASVPEPETRTWWRCEQQVVFQHIHEPLANYYC